MPKAHHHKKHGPKRKHRAHAGGHHHSPAHAKRSDSHHASHRSNGAEHEHFGSLPDALRKKLARPVTVKTLKDIVALRRVQRGG